MRCFGPHIGLLEGVQAGRGVLHEMVQILHPTVLGYMTLPTLLPLPNLALLKSDIRLRCLDPSRKVADSFVADSFKSDIRQQFVDLFPKVADLLCCAVYTHATGVLRSVHACYRASLI